MNNLVPVRPAKCRWRAKLTVVVALLSITAGLVVQTAAVAHANPSASASVPPLSVRQAEMRSRLMTSHMRLRGAGRSEFAMDTLLTLDMLKHNKLYDEMKFPKPPKEEFLAQRYATLRADMESRLKSDKFGKREFLKWATELAAGADISINVGASLGIEGGVGVSISGLAASLAKLILEDRFERSGTIADRVAASSARADWMLNNADQLEGVWAWVLTVSDNSIAFNRAWSGNVGYGYGVVGNASLDWLSNDPVLKLDGKLDEVRSLILNSGQINQERLKELIERMVVGSAGRLADLREDIVGDLRYEMENRRLEDQRTQEEYEAAQAAARQRQQTIEAVQAGFHIASMIAKYTDNPRLAGDIDLIGKATVMLANAFNEFLPNIKNVDPLKSITAASTAIFTGNVVMAVTTLLPIFGVAAGPSDSDLIFARIDELRNDVHALHDAMDDRFDHIDRSLNQLYGAMLDQFALIDEDTENLSDRVDEIHTALTDVANRMNLYGRWQMKALGELMLDDFAETIDGAIDYERRRGHPMSEADTDEYGPAERDFHHTALTISKYAPFSVAKETWGSEPLDVLEGTDMGPYEALGYLTNYAHGIDPRIPAPGDDVSNPTVWATAARAYSLLQQQNPEIARTWPMARVDDILDRGRALQALASPLAKPAGAPDEWGSRTNPLFKELMRRYRSGFADFVQAVESDDIKDSVPLSRKVEIFGGVDQDVAWPGYLQTSSTAIAHCANGDDFTMPAPNDPFHADVLKNRYRVLATYMPTNSYEITTCWDSYYADDTGLQWRQYPARGLYREANHVVVVKTQWRAAGSPPIDIRTVTKDNGRSVIEYRPDICPLPYPPYAPLPCGPAVRYQGPNERARASWDPATVISAATEERDFDHESDVAHQVQDMLNASQKTYFGVIGARIDGRVGDIGNAVKKMNEALLLLRAYTELGLPLSIEYEDRLKALLYGGKDMPLLGNLQGEGFLSYIYHRAAVNPCDPGGPCKPLAGQEMLTLSDESASDCHPDRVVWYDKLTQCLSLSLDARMNRLQLHYSEVFEALADPATGFTEEWPFVAETLAELEWTSKAVRAQRLSPVNKDAWSLVSADSQETAATDGRAINAFDLDVNTMWQTARTGGVVPPPHEVVIDLGRSYLLDAMTYTARQDGNAAGRVGDYEVYVSNYTNDWGAPVAAGKFRDVARAQTVRFDSPATGRFLRLRALSEAGNRTGYIAVAEIDVNGLPVDELHIMNSVQLPKDGWSATVDSQETAGETAPGAHAIDGSPFTKWVSKWSAGGAPMPHHITVDMGAEYIVDGVTYMPRQDANPSGGQYAGYIGDFEVYVSSDGTTWGAPMTTGQFADSRDMQTARFLPMKARYVKLVALTEAGARGAVTSIAELGVTTPQSDRLPDNRWSVVAVDSAETDPGAPGAHAIDGNPNTYWHTMWRGQADQLPHHITVDLGGTRVIDGLTYLPRPATGVNGTVGRYEVYVSTDGSTWGPPAAKGTFADNALEKRVHFTPRPARYVKFVALSEAGNRGPWTTVAELGFTAPRSHDLHRDGWVATADNAQAGEAAGNAIDGNPATVWSTAVTGTPAPLPHHLTVDLGHDRFIDGITYLPRQTGTTNGRVGRYEVYLSPDGSAWGVPVATGSLADIAEKQQVRFGWQWSARFVRLVVLSEAGNRGQGTAIAEFGVTSPQSQTVLSLKSAVTGQCLAANGLQAVLAGCDGAAEGQQWMSGEFLGTDGGHGILMTKSGTTCLGVDHSVAPMRVVARPMENCGLFRLAKWSQGMVLEYWSEMDPLAVSSVMMDGSVIVDQADDSDTNQWVVSVIG